jgi:hypothetical protein
VHTIYDKCLLDCIFRDHFMESVIKPENSLRIWLKIKIFVETVLKNERVLRSHGVIWLTWILFNTKKIFND